MAFGMRNTGRIPVFIVCATARQRCGHAPIIDFYFNIFGQHTGPISLLSLTSALSDAAGAGAADAGGRAVAACV